MFKEPLRQLWNVFWMLNQVANPNSTHINSMFGLIDKPQPTVLHGESSTSDSELCVTLTYMSRRSVAKADHFSTLNFVSTPSS